MNDQKVTIKDDNGRDCYIKDIRKFQRHLKKFHNTGVSIHDEDGHFFTVDDPFRQKIDELVEERS